MRTSIVALAALLAVIGMVWIGQGSGAIAGGAMSGSSFWTVVGAVFVVLAALLAGRERSRALRSRGTAAAVPQESRRRD